jgi:hypothetical protein
MLDQQVTEVGCRPMSRRDREQHARNVRRAEVSRHVD